jgi:hypothetical protein
MIGGGVGGIVASVAFKASEKPNYTVSDSTTAGKLWTGANGDFQTGVYVTLAFSILSILVIHSLSFHFWRANKQVKAGTRVLNGMQGWYYTY